MEMVVVAHALVAPPWSNRRSMVISRLLNEHFDVFGLCQYSPYQIAYIFDM